MCIWGGGGVSSWGVVILDVVAREDLPEKGNFE